MRIAHLKWDMLAELSRAMIAVSLLSPNPASPPFLNEGRASASASRTSNAQRRMSRIKSSSVSRRWFFSTTFFKNRIAAHTTRLIFFFASRWMMIGEAMPTIPKRSSGLRKATYFKTQRRGDAEDAEI